MKKPLPLPVRISILFWAFSKFVEFLFPTAGFLACFLAGCGIGVLLAAILCHFIGAERMRRLKGRVLRLTHRH